ncbi:type IV secretion system DNA-binding domain-containing protein [Patescibacteria group bacterium]|nr:type IV secretion system DNA-binding domain-containing protein [Patescibacteria group bacterium]
MNPEQITYFAETDARNKKRKFGIKAPDRAKHVYIIGKTGMGKSTLIENMLVQDIKNGEGLALIDPHGASAEKILDYIPDERIEDVLYFAPFDLEHPISFNVMEDVGYDKRHLVVSGLMSAFRKVWVDAWSARMEYILTNTLLALLEYPDATMLGVNKMYVDKVFRKKVVENVKDPLVKAFWEGEFAMYTDRYTQEATPAIQNKIGQFTGNPLIRNIIGQPKSTFDFRKMIDERKIIIINLSKGRVGEVNANLLGSMIITKIYLAAMSRADVSEAEMNKLPNFYFYVDEFQSFANESFADILSESRKYKLNLTIAHQYIEQMSDEVRAAVFGNVGTIVTFRVGAYDAEVLEKEFSPTFYAEDLVNLGFTQIYLKLMIDGVASRPFSATTLPPIEPPPISNKDKVILSSRRKYSHPRAGVEAEISKLHVIEKPAPKKKEAHGGERHQQHQGGAPHTTDHRKDNRPGSGERSRDQHRPQMEISRHKEQLHQIAKGIKTKRHETENHVRKDPSALKNALAYALKSAPEASGDAKPKPREEEKSTKESVSSSESKKESAEAGAVADKNTKVGEVPESVLRDMLDVKNDK